MLYSIDTEEEEDDEYSIEEEEFSPNYIEDLRGKSIDIVEYAKLMRDLKTRYNYKKLRYTIGKTSDYYYFCNFNGETNDVELFARLDIEEYGKYKYANGNKRSDADIRRLMRNYWNNRPNRDKRLFNVSENRGELYRDISMGKSNARVANTRTIEREDSVNAYQINNLTQQAEQVGLTDNENNGVVDDWVDCSIATNPAAYDEEFADENEGKTWVKAYHSMAKIDGNYYAPVNSKEKQEDGSYKLGEPAKVGDVILADERPEIAFKADNGKWYVNLKKTDGKDVSNVAYNPYMHSSPSMLNDQFKGAITRPELKTMEVRVPMKELENPYWAGKVQDENGEWVNPETDTPIAKDPTGLRSWNTGAVASLLNGTKDERNLYLTRYFKVVREVPDDEVAKEYVRISKDYDVAFPINVMPPNVAKSFAEQGGKVGNPTANMGNSVPKDMLELVNAKTENVKDYRKRMKEEKKKASSKLSAAGKPVTDFKDDTSTAKVRINNENRSIIYDNFLQLSDKVGRENVSAKDFLKELQQALLLSTNGTGYVRMDIDNVPHTLRIADHSINAKNNTKQSEKSNFNSIVIKVAKKSHFTSADDVELTEYIYYPKLLTKEKQQSIIKGLEDWIYTGKYDVEADRINVSPKSATTHTGEFSTEDDIEFSIESDIPSENTTNVFARGFRNLVAWGKDTLYTREQCSGFAVFCSFWITNQPTCSI